VRFVVGLVVDFLVVVFVVGFLVVVFVVGFLVVVFVVGFLVVVVVGFFVVVVLVVVVGIVVGSVVIGCGGRVTVGTSVTDDCRTNKATSLSCVSLHEIKIMQGNKLRNHQCYLCLRWYQG
jgi:hypothetical protein